MNVRCGKGRRVHAAERHVLNPDYVRTRCGYVGTTTSAFYSPWMQETDEPLSCRACLKASNQDRTPDVSDPAKEPGDA